MPTQAGRVRDMGVRIAMNRSIFFVALTLVASLATAMVYGFGGLMAVSGIADRSARCSPSPRCWPASTAR